MATFYYHYLLLLLLLKVVAFVFILVLLPLPFFLLSSALRELFYLFIYFPTTRKSSTSRRTDGRAADEQRMDVYEFSLAVGWNLFLMVAAMVWCRAGAPLPRRWSCVSVSVCAHAKLPSTCCIASHRIASRI